MTSPIEIWRLIERADERIKYAQARDVVAARTQAREALDRAEALLEDLDDPTARAALRAQIARRREDLVRMEQETP